MILGMRYAPARFVDNNLLTAVGAAEVLLHALAARPDHEAIALLVPDVVHWAKRTTRARNDLAHEGNTPDHCFDELIAVVEVATAVVILNVLHELGLPAGQQRQIVWEHPQLKATSRSAGE